VVVVCGAVSGPSEMESESLICFIQSLVAA
jgi:hypothetical protein